VILFSSCQSYQDQEDRRQQLERIAAMNNQGYTIDQVAELADATVSTIRRHIRRKKLKAKKARGYVVEAAELKKFLLDQASLSRAGRKKKVAVEDNS
jgi:IS30 family transposase